MASRIPKSFGVVKNKYDQAKGDGARPEKKVIPKNLASKVSIPTPTPVLKKKDVVDLTNDVSKKPKADGMPFETQSLTFNHFGPLTTP